MSYPILYKANETNFSTLGLGVLSDTTSALVTEERNGQFYLEMQYPIDGVRFNELKNDRLIKADAGNKLKSQRFKIDRITKPSKGIVTIHARHVSYHAEELQLKPEVNYSGNAQNALNTWRNNLVDAHPFTVYSDIQTAGSGQWTIEEVENARRALGGVRGSLLDSYGGEYRFDNYHIGLYAQRGDDSGALIAYGKNLIELEQEEEIASTYTSIYPFSVYVKEDGTEELVTLPEFFVDSEHVGNYARRKIIRVDFTTEDIQSVEQLRSRAQQYIESNDIGIPKVNLKLKFIDLAKTLDYKQLKLIEEINLCDWIQVNFEKLDIVQRAKIIKTVWNILLDRYEELEVGEARASLSKIIDATVDGKVVEKIDPITRRLNIVMTAANGKNKNFYGPDKPAGDLKIGDAWYKPVGDGEFELYIYNGHTWGDPVVVTGVNSEINRRLEEAKDIAERARDHSNLLQLDADSILSGLGVEGIVEVNQAIVADIQTNVKDRIDNLVSDVGDLPTVDYVNQEINKVEGSITTEIAKVTSNPTETIAGYNTLKTTAEGNTTTIANMRNSPEGYIVGYQSIKETSDLYERVIGSSEEGIKDSVARIVMSDSIFQTELLDELAGTQSQVSQLADSWALTLTENDDIVTAINASSEGVYISGNSIVLNGDTVVDGSFTVTDEFFAANMSIDKFTAGTLNAANVNLINVNVSSLVGERSEFVRSAWNAIGAGVTIDGNGILSVNESGGTTNEARLSDGSLSLQSNITGDTRRVRLDGAGLVYTTDSRTGRIRFNGTNFVFDTNIGLYGNHINSVSWIGLNSSTTHLQSHPTQSGSALVDGSRLALGNGTRDNFEDIMVITSGLINGYKNLNMRDNWIESVQRLTLHSSNTELLTASDNASGVLRSGQQLILGIRTGSGISNTSARITIGGRIDMHRNVWMNGNVLYGQTASESDRRLKEDINDTEQNSLSIVKDLTFVEYLWKNSEYPQGEQFGLIAQDVDKSLQLYDEQSDIYSINTTKLTLINAHAIQQIASDHENTLLVASHGYILAEQHEEEIDCLKREVKVLKDEIEELRGMCA